MTWYSALAWLVALALLNSIAGLTAGAWGGDWRETVPSVCMGIVLGENLICAANVVWGRGSTAVRVVFQFLAIGASAPVGAVATRPQPAHADVIDWLAVLFLFSACTTLTLFCVYLSGVKTCTIGFTSVAPHRRSQWRLSGLFSLTTVVGLWLGIAVAFAPHLVRSAWGPRRWGEMLFIDAAWIPLACLACCLSSGSPMKLIWIPFGIAPIVSLLGAFFEVGQQDLSLQGWLAGPHQEAPDLDYLLTSGLSARLTVTETATTIVTVFFAIWRFGGVRVVLQPTWSTRLLGEPA